jgi:hypothetical protein
MLLLRFAEAAAAATASSAPVDAAAAGTGTAQLSFTERLAQLRAANAAAAAAATASASASTASGGGSLGALPQLPSGVPSFSAAASPEVRTLVNSYLLATLRGQNSTGLVPPIERINELLRQYHGGDSAMQIIPVEDKQPVSNDTSSRGSSNNNGGGVGISSLSSGGSSSDSSTSFTVSERVSSGINVFGFGTKPPPADPGFLSETAGTSGSVGAGGSFTVPAFPTSSPAAAPPTSAATADPTPASGSPAVGSAVTSPATSTTTAGTGTGTSMSTSTSTGVGVGPPPFGSAPQAPILPTLPSFSFSSSSPSSSTEVTLPEVLMMAPPSGVVRAGPPGATAPTEPAGSYFATPFDRDLDAALRAVRFGTYDTLYGVLESAGYQFIAIGVLISLFDEPTSVILIVVGNELLSLGYAFGAIKGIEEIEVAMRELNELLARHAAETTTRTGVAENTPTVPRATVTSANAPGGPAGVGAREPPQTPAGAAAAGRATEPTREGQQIVRDYNPAQALLLSGNPALPFNAFETGGTFGAMSVEPEDEGDQKAHGTNSASAADSEDPMAALGLTCPAFLFANWQRMETDELGTGATKTAGTASSSPSSVLLRFSDNGFERLERAIVQGEHRIRSQRWTGALQVDCAWPVTPPTSASSPAAAPVSSPPAAPSSRVLDTLRRALAMPLHQTVGVTVTMATDPTAAFAPLTVSTQEQPPASAVPARELRFSYMTLGEKAQLVHVLVDRRPDATGKRRAYLRL